MIPQQNRKALVLFLLAAGLLILLAIGLPQAFNPAVRILNQSTSRELPLLTVVGEGVKGDFSWIFYLVMVVYILGFVALFLTPDGRKRAVVLGALLGLLLLFFYLFPSDETPTEEVLVEGPTATASIIEETLPTEPAEAVPMQPPPSAPDWMVTVTVIVLAVFLAGILAVLWIAFSGRFRRPISISDEISLEVQAALDELEAGGDFPDVVIRCYARMSQVLQEARGLAREESMTPHEFETSLIQYGFPEVAVHNLTRLFEDVRYGSLKADEKGTAVAVESLSAIVAFCQEEKTG
jgi:hypothetical protein